MSTSKRSSQERSQGSRKPRLRYRIKIVWFYLCSWVKLAWLGSRFWVEDQLLKLSPEARRLKKVEADFKRLVEGNTTIHEIMVKNGLLTINATSNAFHFLSLLIVEYMESLGAKNFVEHDCELRLWSGPVGLRITVQKDEGKSPATLKDEAVERAKALEDQIANIHKLFAEAQSYSQGELLSEIALVVDWERPVETSPKYDPSVIVTFPDKSEAARKIINAISEEHRQSMIEAERQKFNEELERQEPKGKFQLSDDLPGSF